MNRDITVESLAKHLRSRAAGIRTAVLDIERATDPGAEALHQLHRNLRRFVVESDVWSALLNKDHRGELEAVRQRVRRLSRLVGEVRDFDVGIQLVAGAATAPSSAETSVLLVGAQHRMQDDARLGRELLRAYIRTERDSGLFDLVDRSLSVSLPPVDPRRLARELEQQDRLRRLRLKSAFQKARKDPKVRRLHRLRGRIRQSRYLCEMAATIEGRDGSVLPRRLTRLESQIGHLNDFAVLARHVNRQAPEVREAQWADGLRKEVRDRRRTVTRELRRGRTRSAVKSFVGPR